MKQHRLELLAPKYFKQSNLSIMIYVAKFLSVYAMNWSVFFTASAGAAAGAIIYFCTYLPFTFIGMEEQYPYVSAQAKWGMSVLPNMAMSIGCKTLAQFESTGAFCLISFFYICCKLKNRMSFLSYNAYI